MRVPLIARWPGKIPGGRVSDHPAAFYDVLPTLAEVVGATPPTDVDGISFLPTLTDRGEQKQHEFLLWEFHGYGGQQAVRMGRWKRHPPELLQGPGRADPAVRPGERPGRRTGRGGAASRDCLEYGGTVEGAT